MASTALACMCVCVCAVLPDGDAVLVAAGYALSGEPHARAPRAQVAVLRGGRRRRQRAARRRHLWSRLPGAEAIAQELRQRRTGQHDRRGQCSGSGPPRIGATVQPGLAVWPAAPRAGPGPGRAARTGVRSGRPAIPAAAEDAPGRPGSGSRRLTGHGARRGPAERCEGPCGLRGPTAAGSGRSTGSRARRLAGLPSGRHSGHAAAAAAATAAAGGPGHRAGGGHAGGRHAGVQAVSERLFRVAGAQRERHYVSLAAARAARH